MRGIADTAYAMREVATGSMPLTWRSLALVCGCWEAHLVSTVSLIAYIFVPMLFGALNTFGIPHHDHPSQRAVIDAMGRCNLVLMVTVLVCHEFARAICRRHLYGLRGPAIPRTPHGVVVHVASYLWLFLGVWWVSFGGLRRGCGGARGARQRPWAPAARTRGQRPAVPARAAAAPNPTTSDDSSSGSGCSSCSWISSGPGSLLAAPTSQNTPHAPSPSPSKPPRFYTVLPMLVVIFKHALNIKSTNYIVAEKKVTTEAHHLGSDLGPALPVSMGALGHGGAGLGGSAGSLSALGGAAGARRK